MDFSEKLAELLTLTGTKNAVLADTLGIGRPYVSRLRTGERKLPHNKRVVREMANFFAGRCTDDFRRNALAAFTSDPRLTPSITQPMLADVIYDYMIGVDVQQDAPADLFLSSFALYAPGSTPESDETSSLPDAQGVNVYYKNAGKRQAIKDLLAFVSTLPEPCTLQLFTDEDYSWLLEDAPFVRYLNQELLRQVKRGVTFERIQPPYTDVEFAFSAIERWLPVYMAGAIRQYYYPYGRDQLHRRTIFIAPGHAVLYSGSVYGDGEPELTLLTRDPTLVDIYARQYDAIRSRCRLAITTSTANSDSLFTVSKEITGIEDTGIYKTDSLSVNTLPPEILTRIHEIGSPFAHRVADLYAQRSATRIQVLQRNIITDIMYLPDLADVRAGKAPIPGTTVLPEGPLYYTVAEYRLHLERVLWHLETYRNYHAILADDARSRDVVMIAKGDDRVLLIKTQAPFAVFNVTEPSMAASFCDYLRRLASQRSASFYRRRTIKRINEELLLLNANND